MTNGVIIMIKGSASPYRGFIKCFDKETVDEYRMDIDSYNIASGTWVRNVNGNDFKIMQKTAASITINALDVNTAAIDITESGYTPIGIVGCRTANTNLDVSQFYMTLDLTACNIVVRNISGASITTSSIEARIMYRKD